MNMRVLRFALLATTFCAELASLLASPAASQEIKAAAPDDQVQAKIDDLAERLGRLLQEKHAEKVVVFDLTGPKDMRAPFGSWLADQVSTALARRYPALQVVDRSSIRPLLDRRVQEMEQASQAGRPIVYDGDKRFASEAGANTWVSGSFSRLASGIGVTLIALRESFSLGISVTALLPLTDQVATLLPPNLDVYISQNGIYDAEIGGVSYPKCLHCEDPSYDSASRGDKCQGTVVLKLVVTPEGRVGDIQVIKEVPKCPGLTQVAVKAVSGWQFQPGVGPDGKAVAVRISLEEIFRLL
jgi:TonB family protein